LPAKDVRKRLRLRPARNGTCKRLLMKVVLCYIGKERVFAISLRLRGYDGLSGFVFRGFDQTEGRWIA